jgi:hypothetical protein
MDNAARLENDGNSSDHNLGGLFSGILLNGGETTEATKLVAVRRQRGRATAGGASSSQGRVSNWESSERA